MADRRTDDQPLAPRRPLTGSAASDPATASKQTGNSNPQVAKPANQQNPTGKNDGPARPGSTGTPKGPADTGTKPVAPGAKPAESGSNPGTSASKPAVAPGAAAPKPSEDPAKQPVGAGRPIPATNKSGVSPSMRSQAGNNPGVTPSSPSQTRNTEGTRPPVTERVSQKVSQAVSATTEAVRAAAETRRQDERRPVTSTGKRPGSGSTRTRTRKARLRLTHIDPWSVMKTAFLLSIALGIVSVIAVAMVWSVLGAAGVWDSINKTVQEVIGGGGSSTFNVQDYIGTSRVLGFTMIVAVVDVVLITAIATLAAFLYNLAATLLGGIEVTLAEEEH